MIQRSDDIVILGIETSCDETAAAVVEQRPGNSARLCSNVIGSQIDLHLPYGGVVPEIACRSHVENLTRVVERAISDSGHDRDALSAIAVAHRPGLIGALLVGVTTAKSLAWAWNKPLLGVHHLEAHLRAAELSGVKVEAPYLGVVLSGGHSDIYEIKATGERTLIGETHDDALGEAFDKVAAMIGLEFPGGPSIEREAENGDDRAVDLPRSLLAKDSLDFSFSGIKTAVLYLWRGQDARSDGPRPGAPRRADIAASFQRVVVDVVIEKVRRAAERTGIRRVVFGGGVTANTQLRERVERELVGSTLQLAAFPEPQFSTDNAAMIALAGLDHFEAGERSALDLEASPS